MNSDLLKRLADIRTSLQGLIADVEDEYGDDCEAAMSLSEADGVLEDAESASVSSDEEEEGSEE